jgi:Glycolipid 2-alpha-mannosyltransferase
MAPYRSFRSMAMVFLPICALLTMTYMVFVSFDTSRFQNDKAQITKMQNTIDDEPKQQPLTAPNNTTTVKAAFVVLVRNSELDDLRSAMRQMEDRFNHRYNYPWVFLNDADFSDEFMAKTKGIASGNTFYGKVDDTMWGYPEWIDQDKASETRENMKEVIYGDSESYRHMCR